MSGQNSLDACLPGVLRDGESSRVGLVAQRMLHRAGYDEYFAARWAVVQASVF